MKKLLRSLFYLVGVLALLFGLFLAYSLRPAVTEPEFPRAGILQFPGPREAPQPALPERLSVVSYNIGYGSGVKNNKVAVADRAEVLRNLDEMAARLAELKPDLLLLQEVDFNSRRSFGIDQMRYLAEKLGMRHGAYVVTWNLKYVPFPYWPPSGHFGKVVSGQAVLSRFPITAQQLIEFPKPDENPFWYNWYYLDRIVQHLTIQLGPETLSLYNLHLEAFAVATREEQLKNLGRLVKADPAEFKIAGGDFNLASRMEAGRQDEDRDLKDLLGEFSRATGLSPAVTAEGVYSMPSWEPYKLIDHIYFSSKFRLEKAGNMANSTASDHLAVWAILGF